MMVRLVPSVAVLGAVVSVALVTNRASSEDRKKVATSLQDRLLGPKIHFSAIHYAEGKDQPRQLVVKGTLGGQGQLTLNPNHLMLDSEGRIRGSTLLGYTPIQVQIKPTNK